MALEFVPHEHIVHLLKAALDGRNASAATRERMLERVNSKETDDQTAVHEYIDRWTAGTIERLDEIWTFRGQCAVMLWSLPFLEGRSISDALENHRLLRRRQGQPVRWVDLPTTAEREPVVFQLRVDEDELRAKVRLFRTTNFTFQGEPDQIHQDADIFVRINFGGRETPYAEAYASQQFGRNALYTFLDWLRGAETPRRNSAARDAILKPIVFPEARVRVLAARLEWEEATEVEGLDVTGDAGTVTYRGKLDERGTGALDLGKARLKRQLDGVNKHRRYRFPFTHPDEYVEEPQMSFHFEKGQSRLQFHKRPSQLAIDYVISEMRDELER